MIKVRIKKDAYANWLRDNTSPIRRDWDLAEFLDKHSGEQVMIDEKLIGILPFEDIKKYVSKIYGEDGEESITF